jgi:glycerol-3-phosphate O-acyltransferase/dihydroxyacetone phosphate acyltransferase
MDPGLILTSFPRQIAFGARHGLFEWPLLGTLMRALGTVPIYRRQDLDPADETARRQANRMSLDALAARINEGLFAALFPEGLSHDEPSPTELKTGAARLYYRARELLPGEAGPPVILPVGLHYDKKRFFGSSVLVAFHPSLEIPDELVEIPKGASEAERRRLYRSLTDRLERELHEIVHATESWELHHAMHRARKLMRAEEARRAGEPTERPTMKERVSGYGRLWKGYNRKASSHPSEVEQLVSRVRDYDADLRALGVEDHELDRDPRLASPGLFVLLVLQAIVIYLFLPPILILGYVTNLPAAAIVWLVARWSSRERKDEATMKLLVGAIVFPLSWLLVALLVAWGNRTLAALYPRIPHAPWTTGVLAFILSALGAYLALHYQRLARNTLRSARVRLTRLLRSRSIARLKEERAELYESMMQLAQGLDPDL